MESRKMVQMKLFAGQEYRNTDIENRHVDIIGKWRVG